MNKIYRKVKDGVYITIWSNFDLNFKAYKENMRHLYPDMNDLSLMKDMHREHENLLRAEREVLDIYLKNKILAICATEKDGKNILQYKIYPANIRCCLYRDTELCQWYVDESGEFRCIKKSPGETTHILYRELDYYPEHITIMKLLDNFNNGTACWQQIENCTKKLGRKIMEAYAAQSKYN